MCENGNVSQIAAGKEDKNEIIDESVTADLNSTVYNDKLCRLCRLPKIGSNLVRPNGELRGCNCDKVQPYHKHGSSISSTNLDDQRPVPVHPNESQLPHNPEIGITENLAAPQNDDMCSAKDRSFEPPQGMDTGEYPRALFYQYYPSRQKSYTFNLLPLPFMEKLEYQTMRALSMENQDIREKWKDFLYNLPDSEFQAVPYPDDKFWRWKNRLRYKPDEGTIDFRKQMQTGPKYDRIGRLPITGEELNMFRKSGGVWQRPKILRKGDGTRKIESHIIIAKQY